MYPSCWRVFSNKKVPRACIQEYAFANFKKTFAISWRRKRKRISRVCRCANATTFGNEKPHLAIDQRCSIFGTRLTACCQIFSPPFVGKFPGERCRRGNSEIGFEIVSPSTVFPFVCYSLNDSRTFWIIYIDELKAQVKFHAAIKYSSSDLFLNLSKINVVQEEAVYCI